MKCSYCEIVRWLFAPLYRWLDKIDQERGTQVRYDCDFKNYEHYIL